MPCHGKARQGKARKRNDIPRKGMEGKARQVLYVMVGVDTISARFGSMHFSSIQLVRFNSIEFSPQSVWG
jgi:hypothetical protein